MCRVVWLSMCRVLGGSCVVTCLGMCRVAWLSMCRVSRGSCDVTWLGSHGSCVAWLGMCCVASFGSACVTCRVVHVSCRVVGHVSRVAWFMCRVPWLGMCHVSRRSCVVSRGWACAANGWACGKWFCRSNFGRFTHSYLFKQRWLLVWQRELHSCPAAWQLQRFVSHFPWQLHLDIPWPPVSEALRAAERWLISAMVFQLANAGSSPAKAAVRLGTGRT